MARTGPLALAGAAAPAAAPLPLDVRLMNAVSAAVFVLAAATLAAAALAWLVRGPWFAIRAVQLEGDLARHNALTIRANTVPRLAGNFFGVDLARAKAAFESVPWVRRAVVRRVWPDRLVVQLEEHRAVALWRGADGSDERLVNSFGEVFEANLGEVEDEALPSLQGPEAGSAQMLAMLHRLQPVFARLELEIETIELTGRGSWRLRLPGGAEIELGRGSEDEIVARSERFARTLTQVSARYGALLEYADLRHADGYALRLQGVRTVQQGDGRKP